MAPVTRAKKKKDEETPVNRSQSEDNQEKKEEDENELFETQHASSDSSQSETSFMDLPDEIHTDIFSLLDLPSRLQLRVNKRLDRIHFSVKANLESIKFITFGKASSQLVINYRTRVTSSHFLDWAKGLRRFALNTSVYKISIIPYSEPSKEQYRIISALLQFKANKLRMRSDFPSINYNLPHLTLPSVLSLAQNVEDVKIKLRCTSISAQDLCTIRKTILEGGCKMRSFIMRLKGGRKKAFVKKCFGVIISDYLGPLRGTVYRTTDDSLEMYRGTGWRGDRLNHYDGYYQTTVDYNTVAFKKRYFAEKSHESFKMKWDHLYEDVYYNIMSVYDQIR